MEENVFLRVILTVVEVCDIEVSYMTGTSTFSSYKECKNLNGEIGIIL